MAKIDLNTRRNSTWIVVAVGALFLTVILFSQLATNPTQYQNRVEKEREMKDLQFKNDPDSPIPKKIRGEFAGLSYFPIQIAYRTEATFVPNAQPDTLQLMSTKGSDARDTLINAGQLQFQLMGNTYTLTAFEYLDQAIDSYFVPFRDLTSAVSTYGGGRYLDLPKEQPLIIDFNRAYQPYCVYNPDYLCPLPPRENKLTLEIMAGEKLTEGQAY